MGLLNQASSSAANAGVPAKPVCRNVYVISSIGKLPSLFAAGLVGVDLPIDLLGEAEGGKVSYEFESSDGGCKCTNLLLDKGTPEQRRAVAQQLRSRQGIGLLVVLFDMDVQTRWTETNDLANTVAAGPCFRFDVLMLDAQQSRFDALNALAELGLRPDITLTNYSRATPAELLQSLLKSNEFADHLVNDLVVLRHKIESRFDSFALPDLCLATLRRLKITVYRRWIAALVLDQITAEIAQDEKQESSKQEPNMQEPERQEPERQEPERQEPAKQVYSPTPPAQTPSMRRTIATSALSAAGENVLTEVGKDIWTSVGSVLTSILLS